MFLAMTAEPVWAEPDLLVANVVVAEEVPAGKNFPVQYHIVNQGDQSATDVSVGVYLNYYTLADQSSLLIGSAKIDSLQPGEARTVEIVGTMPPDIFIGSWYYVSVLADYPHLIDEPDDGNNQYYARVVPVTGTVCEADAFETDSSMTQARPLYLGDKRAQNLCDGSNDWLYFDATAGQTYIVTTAEGSYSSVSLMLTDAAGNTLATNPFYEIKPSITWTAPAGGRYFVKVAPFGSGYRYTLSLEAPAADLVESSARFPGAARAGALLRFDDSVENRGSVAAGPSEIGYYLSTDEFVTTDDLLLDVHRIPGVGPGGWAQITDDGLASLPVDLLPGTYWLGSIADHTNQVSEFREHNNASRGAEFQILSPLCAPDSFENDDFAAHAASTEPGATSTHNFCDDAIDRRSFEAIGGQTYVIETSNIGPHVTPIVTLYGPDAKTVLRYETPPFGSSSNIHTVRIVWQAPEGGRYFVSTAPGTAVGEGTTYSITIAPQLALPDLAVRTQGWNTGLDDLIAGGMGTMPVIVRNDGFSDAGPSTAGIYLSRDWNVTTDDLLLKQVEIPAVTQGTELYYNGIPHSWTYPATLAPGTYYLSAIADNTGQISEFSEVNNLAYPLTVVISAPPCAPDPHEEDDFPEYAKPFQIGVPQAHNGCDDGRDYMYFDVAIGGIYSFSVSDVGSNYDVTLSVWDSTGNRRVWEFLYAGQPYETTLPVGRYLMRAETRMGPNTAYTLNVKLVRKLRGGK
jgi:hypothetical protein